MGPHQPPVTRDLLAQRPSLDHQVAVAGASSLVTERQQSEEFGIIHARC